MADRTCGICSTEIPLQAAKCPGCGLPVSVALSDEGGLEVGPAPKVKVSDSGSRVAGADDLIKEASQVMVQKAAGPKKVSTQAILLIVLAVLGVIAAAVYFSMGPKGSDTPEGPLVVPGVQPPKQTSSAPPVTQQNQQPGQPAAPQPAAPGAPMGERDADGDDD